MRIQPIVLCAALAACSGSSIGIDNDTVVSLHAGSAQVAFANASVPIRPAVLVTSAGEPVAGVTVTFRVTQGGGSVQGATQVTGTDGIARVDGWTLGPIGPQALEAVIGDVLGSPVLFAATAVNAVPAIVTITRGNGGTGTVGLPVSETPALRLTDASGRPVAGIPVSWSITAGNGGFRYADNVTDADGRAGLVKWVLGTVAGHNAVTANVDCGAVCGPITFTATGVPAPVFAMSILRGHQQSSPAGGTVEVPPAVRVRDAHGNAVPQQVVTWMIVAGDGSLTTTQTLSDDNGVATAADWRVGLGQNLLRAYVDGVAVLFEATGTP